MGRCESGVCHTDALLVAPRPEYQWRFSDARRALTMCVVSTLDTCEPYKVAYAGTSSLRSSEKSAGWKISCLASGG